VTASWFHHRSTGAAETCCGLVGGYAVGAACSQTDP
jgi:hypothetical protein